MSEARTHRQRAGRLRTAVVSHPAIQPLVFAALTLAYIWVIRPTGNDWLKIPVFTIIVLIPFTSNFFHRDRLRELGLRLDNLWASGVQVGLATLIGVIAVVGVGMLTGSGPDFPRGAARSFLLYPLWGLTQQYAMQSFTYRRIREGSGRPVLAAAISATLFASAHWPNPALALMTLVGGYVWCRLFERHPNLITLALSHGWLAVLLRYSWPAEWLHNLRIGPDYWAWTP